MPFHIPPASLDGRVRLVPTGCNTSSPSASLKYKLNFSRRDNGGNPSETNDVLADAFPPVSIPASVTSKRRDIPVNAGGV